MWFCLYVTDDNDGVIAEQGSIDIFNDRNISEKADVFVDFIRADEYNYSRRKEMILMSSVLSAIKDTVPISNFNRGLAGKILNDVKKHGPKVVMKNNVAEAVIISPDEYVDIQNELNDYLLLTLAVERMAGYDPDTVLSQEEMDKLLNVTQEDIDSVGEVDIE